MATIVYAQGIKGRKGDTILRLGSGKIAFPKDFTPREGEWYLVEILQEYERYAIVRLHKHVDSGIGICSICHRVIDKARLETFVEQWISNMLHKEKIKKISQISGFVIGRLGELEIEVRDMLYKLNKELEKYMVSEFICPPGHPVVDSCFADRCIDSKRCEQLNYMIKYLRGILEQLEEKYQRALRSTLEPDRVVTIYTLGIETIRV